MPDSSPAAAAPFTLSQQPVHAGAGQRQVVAWLNNWAEPDKLRESHVFDGYWRGANEIAQKFGFELEECVVGQGQTLPQLTQSLAERNVKAMLVAPLQIGGISPEWEESRHWEPFSAVRLGHTGPFPAFHLVTPDQAGNTRLAFSCMQERGYRRIGFVASQHAAQHLLFKAGFLLAQFEVDSRLRIPPLVLDETTPDQGRASFSKWLDGSNPDAILTDLPFVRTLLTAAGYGVPKDIGVASCSVTNGNAEAGIFENAEEVGRVAVLTILSLLNNQCHGVPDIRRQVLIAGHWKDGATLPARTRSSH